MTTWPTKKLGEIIEISYGKGLPKDSRIDSGKYFAYGSNGPVYSTDKSLTNGETIVIGRKGTAGALYFISDPCWPIDTTFFAKPKSDVSLKFVYYLLQTKKLPSRAIVTGVPGINRTTLSNIHVHLPPLQIQKQIVERLDKIVEAQKLNDGLIQKTDELFQSLLHKELNPAGKNWEVKKLDEIAKIIMGQSPPSTSYNESGNGLPFFQGKADFGDLYPNTVKYCSAPSRIAEPEDILISVRAPVGDINLTKDKSCIGRGLAAIRGNNKIVEQMLLYFLFKKNEKNWQRQSTGSTFAAITKDKLTDYKIPMPPLDIQKQIVAKLSAVQDCKTKLLAQRAKLKELFDSVLNKSMTQPSRKATAGKENE